MLQISNKTPFTVDIAVFPDEEGIDSAIAVLKATFEIVHEKICISKIQQPVVKNDEYWGEPGKSSLKYASEICLPKPSTDIVMNGHACAPEGKAVYALNVSLRVGRYFKKALVFGDRYWKRSLGMCSKTDPVPFVRMPLIYENAFGGEDIHRSDNRRADCEPRNPVGCGFMTKEGESDLKLPNIEDPDNTIKSWKDHPAPVGFGYISPSWEPRIKYAGTYDETWRKNRAPFLPHDFDCRFFNCAYPDLITESYLKGDEPVIIENVGRHGTVSFRLPLMKLEFVFNIDGKRITRRPNLDTLLIEPDEKSFSMIWRACERCDKKALKIRNVEFFCLESDIDFGRNDGA